MKKENFIYGIRPIIEAIRGGKEIEKIFLQKGSKGDLMNELMREAQDHQVPVLSVPAEKLNRLGNVNHQGVMAILSPITYHTLENLIPQLFEEGKVPLILVLDRVTDVRNFGAIVRTAECAGVHAVVIPSRNSAAINEDAVKTSAGALHIMPVCREENLKTSIHFLKASGIRVFAATERGHNAYTEADFTIPTAFIMGSEEDGVSPEFLKLCDERLRIPQKGEISSLNVSVAAGVLLYEVLRQRN